MGERHRGHELFTPSLRIPSTHSRQNLCFDWSLHGLIASMIGSIQMGHSSSGVSAVDWLGISVVSGKVVLSGDGVTSSRDVKCGFKTGGALESIEKC